MILTRNSSAADSYYELVKDGSAFVANTSITGLVAFGTAAAIGGPLLWNNTGVSNQRVMAVILGLSVGWTTAPAASGTVGLTTGSGQASAPTSTTAITGVDNLRADLSATNLCNVYNAGTVTSAGTAFFGTHQVGTTAGPSGEIFVPLDGLIQVPPGCWAAVAGAVAVATMVAKCSLVWAEVPY